MSKEYNLVGIKIWTYVIGEGGVEEWDFATEDDFEVLSDISIRTSKNFSIEVMYHREGSEDIIRKDFVIPKGWTFDGASIPPVFWNLIGEPTEKDFRIPAMVHDWLYGERFNRELSDEIFKELLDLDGVSVVHQHLMWLAVRVFGHTFYASDTSDFWKKVREIIT